MANLGQKSTSGELSWDKYIKNNPLYSDKQSYVIEDGADAVLYDSSFRPIDVMKPKTEIKILDRNYISSNNKRYAKIKVGSKNGLTLISSIRKPTGKNTLKDEQMAMESFDKLFKEIGSPVTVKVGRHFYKDIIGVENVDGTPKADFALIDKNKRRQIFISHKKAGGPEAFQQHGGLTEKAGPEIYSHIEVQSFMAEVVQGIVDNKLQYPMYRLVKDKKLIGMSIYGPNFGSTTFSEENVNLIGQGMPILNKVSDDTYELKFSSHMSVNPDLNHFTGGYTPVFGATYREGRGFTFLGNSYKGARAGIYPEKLMSGRSGVKKV